MKHVFLFLLLVCVVFYNDTYKILVYFLENTISPDNNITDAGNNFLRVCWNHMLIMFLSINFICYLNQDIKERIVFGQIYKPSVLVVKLFVLVLLFLMYYLFPQKYPMLYSEDGFFENMTGLFFFISSIFFYVSIKYVTEKKLLKIFNCIAILVSLFIALEEISYGQRIFNWVTPALFDSNLQNETNLHNFVINGGEYTYFLISYVLFAYFLFSLFMRYYYVSIETSLLFFSYSDILLIIFISIFSRFDAEATEFFISILILEGSTRNYVFLRKKYGSL